MPETLLLQSTETWSALNAKQTSASRLRQESSYSFFFKLFVLFILLSILRQDTPIMQISKCAFATEMKLDHNVHINIQL